jgi:hypothetical protein
MVFAKGITQLLDDRQSGCNGNWDVAFNGTLANVMVVSFKAQSVVRF